MARPLLSLALIMRDAQEDIIPCLSSCAGAVDEMVICDTGSRDASVAKARKFLRKWLGEDQGRRGEVCRFRWRDDFAAAKNFALSRAHGRYALLLDSDERLSEETRGNLRPLVEALARGDMPEGGALTGPALWQGTGGQAVDAVEFWRLNVERDGSPISGEEWDQAVRLARLGPDLRYQGEVHEQLVRSDGANLISAAIEREKILVIHTGYAKGLKEEKIRRNHRILLREEERGGSTYMLELYLAQLHMARKEFAKAAGHAMAALQESRPVHDRAAPWRMAANAWLEEENRAQAAGETAALAKARRELAGVLQGAMQELPEWPDFPYIRSVGRWNEADAREDRQGKEEALSEMEQAQSLASQFSRRHPDQVFAFAAMLPSLTANLEQMRRELGKL